MPCTNPYQDSALPVDSCPADTDLLMFSQADGTQVFRTWGTVRSCLLTQIKAGFLEIVVGVTRDNDGNIMMDDTATSLTILQANIIQDSIWITLGVEVPRDQEGVQVQDYTPIYAPDGNSVTCNFLQNYSNDDVLIFHYLYLIQSSVAQDTFDDTFDNTFF